MSSSRNRNPCVEAVIAELRAAGLSFTVSDGARRHRKIRWLNAAGQTRTVVTSNSTSCQNAPWSARAAVRRILRDDGLIK
jgi:hypothetical protein